MKNVMNILLFVCLGLSGCAGVPQKTDIKNDQPLIQIPVNEPENQMGPAQSDRLGFEDISLSAKKRMQVLTNKMEVDKQRRIITSIAARQRWSQGRMGRSYTLTDWPRLI